MRWAWVGLAIVSAVGYLWMNPIAVVVQFSGWEEGDPSGPEKDEVENLEEDGEVDEEVVLMDTGVDDEGPAEAQAT